MGNTIGGVNVFGGGLALYHATGVLIGGARRERGLVVHGPQHCMAKAAQS
jgi:hypothetical protein